MLNSKGTSEREIGLKEYQLAETIRLLTGTPGVSGYEHGLLPVLEETFKLYADDIYTDYMGSFYAIKKGQVGNQTVMLAAHSDEIGLIVTHIDKGGFLHFSTVGGIDERTLLYQEVTVHGLEDIPGIVSFLPDHSSDKKKSIKFVNMAIDTGHSFEKITKLVNPGDIISINRKPLNLLNQTIAGKALDDRAGIAVMRICLVELSRIKHKHNVAAISTVQEEVGLRGAITSTDRLIPNIAVVIDVTHAQTIDAKNQVSIHLGKGPAISLGPNIHPALHSLLTTSAQENNIPYQTQPISGPSGTDARVIQLSSSGIPTGLLAIPIRYMHTSVETASLKDIVNCGKLLARFIADLPDDLEGISCC